MASGAGNLISIHRQSRQLSLKLCANASYGFTGSDVSPLGGKALAESCVRWGNWYCRRARDVIEAEVEGAEVLYAQTDSLFIRLPGRSHAEAAAEGCLLYTSPSPRDQRGSRMPSSA